MISLWIFSIFLTLKLTNTVDWSWWWLLIPAGVEVLIWFGES